MTLPRPSRIGRALPLLLLVLASLLACGTEPTSREDLVEAPPLVVRASVDRSEVGSGDQVRMTVEVDFDASFEVAELNVGDEVGGLEVLERGRNTLRTVRGRTGLVDWFVLRPPTPGSYVLPPLDVVAVGPDSEEVRSATNEVFVEVTTRLAEDAEAEGLRGLKPPVEPPARWPWLVGLAVLLLLLTLIWWWRRVRSREPLVPELAPHEVAFEELEALRSTDFTDLSQLRRYYYELSAVLRRYVEGRFDLNATDLTSQEIRARLAELGLQSPQEEKLKRFFDATDGVKYAAQVPTERAVETVYESVLTFVEETMPSQTESEGETGPEEEIAPEVANAPTDGTARADDAGLPGQKGIGDPTGDAGAADPDARFKP